MYEKKAMGGRRYLCKVEYTWHVFFLGNFVESIDVKSHLPSDESFRRPPCVSPLERVRRCVLFKKLGTNPNCCKRGL